MPFKNASRGERGFFFSYFYCFYKKKHIWKKNDSFNNFIFNWFFFFKIYDNYEIPIQNYIFVKDNFKIIEVISFKKR